MAEAGQPVPVESQPTASARLTFSTRPIRLETGTDGVPAGDTRTLIAVSAMVMMGLGGIIGAGVVMYIAKPGALGWFLGLALAELVFALVVIVLIARQGRPRRSRGRARPRGTAQPRLSRPDPEP